MSIQRNTCEIYYSQKYVFLLLNLMKAIFKVIETEWFHMSVQNLVFVVDYLCTRPDLIKKLVQLIEIVVF
jgi:hypothetical protein